MAHFIQAIVGTNDTIARINQEYPTLISVTLLQGFSMIPVSAELIDTLLPSGPESRPESTDTFVLLTPGFEEFLSVLSNVGQIAYVETEYFGGTGGQGALVLHKGQFVMKAEWSSSGTINDALKILGVKRTPVPFFADEFKVVGLDKFRSNDDFLEAGGVD